MQFIILIGQLAEDAVLRQGNAVEYVSFPLLVKEMRGSENITIRYSVTTRITGIQAKLKKDTKIAVLGKYSSAMLTEAGAVLVCHNVVLYDFEILNAATSQIKTTQGDELPERWRTLWPLKEICLDFHKL